VAMTLVVNVRDAEGKVLGNAAALFESTREDGPRGAILFVASAILTDSRVAEGVVCDLVQWIAGRLGVEGL
jgi:hypothetical protein